MCGNAFKKKLSFKKSVSKWGFSVKLKKRNNLLIEPIKCLNVSLWTHLSHGTGALLCQEGSSLNTSMVLAPQNVKPTELKSSPHLHRRVLHRETALYTASERAECERPAHKQVAAIKSSHLLLTQKCLCYCISFTEQIISKKQTNLLFLSKLWPFSSYSGHLLQLTNSKSIAQRHIMAMREEESVFTIPT